MKFGLGPYDLASAGGREHAAVYQEMLAQAAVAEESAFDSVWLSEHHFSQDGLCPTPAVAAAALAVRTQAVRIGLLCTLGVTHPLYLAEDVATLDNIAHGRVICGFFKPSRREELAGYNVPEAERDGRFWEALEVVLKAWAPQPFRHQGRHYRIPANLPENVYAEGYSQISITPKPPQLSIPVWLVATDHDAVERAARVGLPVLGRPMEALSHLKEKFDLYRRTRQQMGAAPVADIVPLIREVYVAESNQKARADVEGPLLALYRRYADWGLLPRDTLSFDALAPDRFIVGDVDHCVEEIARYRDELGVNYLICRMDFPGLEHKRVLDSIRLFGRGVISEFRMFGFPKQIRVRSLQEVRPEAGPPSAEAGS